MILIPEMIRDLEESVNYKLRLEIERLDYIYWISILGQMVLCNINDFNHIDLSNILYREGAKS